MVVAYAKQETVEPLKGIGRFLAFGVLGALLTSIGLVALAVAGLRAIQVETGDRLTGGWSWVPYAGVLVAALLIAAFSASRIGKKGR
jgi:membrane protein DedA with SNARE-associated domain